MFMMVQIRQNLIEDPAKKIQGKHKEPRSNENLMLSEWLRETIRNIDKKKLFIPA